jgi:ABC-type multidrug transport system fused ATPase/permease subunit
MPEPAPAPEGRPTATPRARAGTPIDSAALIPTPPAPASNGEVIRRLVSLSWEYRRDCLIVFAYQGALLALGLAGLGAVGKAVDIIRHGLDATAPAPRWPLGIAPPAGLGPLGVVMVLSLAVLLMAALRSLFNYRYSISVGRLLQMDLVPRLRAQVFDKLLRLDFRFFDGNASGSIINRVTSDVQHLRSFLDGVLIQGGILLLSLGVYVAYMLGKNVALTVACLATTPLLWVGTALFSRWVQPAYAENRDLADKLVLALSEGVQGIYVVRGFGGEQPELARFRARNHALLKQQHRIFRRVSVFSPAVSLMGQINIVVLLFYGGWVVKTGGLSLGDLIVFAGLLQQFSGQITNLATVVNTLQQSLIGARRVFEVLDAPIRVQSPATPVRAPIRGAVRFENVSFAYKEGVPVIGGIDLDVPVGSRIAILGETGAGKTTLLSLIPRFYDSTRGRVLIDGHDVRAMDLRELRQQVGVVFQESFLFSDTVAGNIAFGAPEASQEQIERAARIAHAHDFIMELPEGYATRVGEGGHGLSGGQRQRLALARALLLEPRILLLDDPAASLDPGTEEELFSALDRAMEGRTTFVIAHRPSTLRRADRIIVLDEGRIVQQGKHEQLMAVAGPYRRVLGMDEVVEAEPEPSEAAS